MLPPNIESNNAYPLIDIIYYYYNQTIVNNK